MSGLEIIGAIALYLVCLVLLMYLAAGIAMFIVHKRTPHAGLEGFIPVYLAFFGTGTVGALGGLVFLGTLIG